MPTNHNIRYSSKGLALGYQLKGLQPFYNDYNIENQTIDVATQSRLAKE
ncbi:MAG: hypothetical protein V3V00_12200 [Saprospiraceae bacterium]